jgi:DNA-binding SARP family transcriptional activator/TolB-like protein/tetratricopeptide (TPR) repeat protein
VSSRSQQINTLPQNDFRLVTLGRLALVRPDGTEDESLGKRRRKLALLAVLALTTRPLERDYLLDMFWGDQDEERARHSLSDALSHLRRALGADSISTRRNDVYLVESTRLSVDAMELAAAVASKDWERATELYAGAFLGFVHVESSPSFEQWVARERDRLQSLFIQASSQQCLGLVRARQWDACAALANRWLESEPLCADAALYLLNALKAPGTRDCDARALAAYERLSAQLGRDYGAKPDRSVNALAAEIARRVAAGDESNVGDMEPTSSGQAPAEATLATAASFGGEQVAASIAAPAPPGGPSSAPSSRPDTHPSRVPRDRHRIGMWAGLTAGGVALVGVFAFAMLRAGAQSASPSKPAIAVMAMHNRTGDTTQEWLSTGLPQMIVADLSRSPSVDVVDPSRLMQVLERANIHDVDDISAGTVLDLGRRTGATWVVDGTLTRSKGAFILDFSVHDVASGKLVRPYVVRDPDVMSLADRAAAKLLGAADARGSGPRVAEVETSSLDAYQHYVRALQADDEGRALDERREVDAAIALDSGFVAALRLRMGMSSGAEADQDTIAQLAAAFERAAPRASAHDRLEQNVYVALRNGERSRSEALARFLVQQYPRDPHSYQTLADVYSTHGLWEAADTVLMRELALDSLAAEAGQGPCAPCVAYGGLISDRVSEGDLVGAEHAGNRWIALQPDLPAAWSSLATILSYEQRFDEALEIARRAAYLAGNDPEYRAKIGRILLMARRWAAADSLITRWNGSQSREMRADAFDLRMLLQRERGQFRAANRTADAFREPVPDAGVLRYMKGNDLGRLGDYAGAIRLYEEAVHAHPMPGPALSPASTLTGDWARAFCWEHALEADAIAASGDTLRLRALADSIEMMSVRSYYGRDWRLAHHVRGLIAMQGHRYSEAERELQSARWGVAGWTRTVAELAKAQLALGRPRDAILTLRDAYTGPLDAMGRYEPRSALDFLMARAFQEAGIADSASVYAGYVRTAWRDADPETKRSLAQLPKESTALASGRAR